MVGVDKSLDTHGHLGRDGRGCVAVNGREVGGDEEDVFLRHDLEYVVGHGVGVLDRVNARLGGDPRRLVAIDVGGDLLLDAVSFLDDDIHLLQRQHAWAGVDDDLDTVRTVVESLPDGTSGFLDAADGDVFLLDELLGLGRQAAELAPSGRQRSCGGNDPRPDDPASLDRLAQGNVAVDARIAQVAHRREARLQVLSRHRHAEQTHAGSSRAGQPSPACSRRRPFALRNS